MLNFRSKLAYDLRFQIDPFCFRPAKWCLKLPQEAFLGVTALNFGHCRLQLKETVVRAYLPLVQNGKKNNNKTTGDGPTNAVFAHSITVRKSLPKAK